MKWKRNCSIHVAKLKGYTAQLICIFVFIAQLISTFVFATRIVQLLHYLFPNFQDSSFLLWVYKPICVGPGRKSRKPVFSSRGAHIVLLFLTSFVHQQNRRLTGISVVLTEMYLQQRTLSYLKHKCQGQQFFYTSFDPFAMNRLASLYYLWGGGIGGRESFLATD